MEGEFGGMFSEMGVFRLDFGSHLPLTYYPSRDNIFCPPPTWTWLSSKEKKRKKKIWRWCLTEVSQSPTSPSLIDAKLDADYEL
ncbi:hypothetical protein GBA52_028950 [Prunus armeniaca]|nr:hypothetical protein GBA52_028950 [Prunus armeniaca]